MLKTKSTTNYKINTQHITQYILKTSYHTHKLKYAKLVSKDHINLERLLSRSAHPLIWRGWSKRIKLSSILEAFQVQRKWETKRRKLKWRQMYSTAISVTINEEEEKNQIYKSTSQQNMKIIFVKSVVKSFHPWWHYLIT